MLVGKLNRSNSFYILVICVVGHSLGGVSVAHPEQVQLVSERMARLLKADSNDKGLLTLFSTEREFDLDDAEPNCLRTFCQSMAALLHSDQFDVLEDVIDLLTEALTFLHRCIPVAKDRSKSGTLLGNALVAFPRGRSLVDDAKLEVGRLETTSKLVTRFNKVTSLVGELLANLRTAGGLIAVDDVGFTNLGNLLAEAKGLLAPSPDVVVKYAPSVSDTSYVSYWMVFYHGICFYGGYN